MKVLTIYICLVVLSYGCSKDSPTSPAFTEQTLDTTTKEESGYAETFTIQRWDGENWIDTETIRAAIQRINARHILLMIDSCYQGSSFKGNKSDIIKSESDWNAEEAIKGLNNRAGLVMASGGATPVVDTVIDDKHSLFAYKFLDILNKNKDFITSSNVFLKIKKYHATQKQVPQFYGVANWGHLDGDFVFKVRK